MDRPLQRKRASRLRVAAIAVVVASLGGGATLVLRSLRPASVVVDRTSVRVQKVRRGPLVRQVQGRGVLAPEHVQWVTATTPARVARILVEAGAELNPDAPIVELQNGDLELAALDADRAAAAADTALVSLEVRGGADLLEQDATIAALDGESGALDARAETNVALAKEGLMPVVDGRETSSRAAGARSRLGREKQRRALLDAGLGKLVKSQRAELSKLKEVASFRHAQVDALTVRAPVAGTVQELPLEPGQWVTAGTVIAKVARPGRLKAVLEIPESLVKDVAVGMSATIDTPSGTSAGRVVRVEPSVQGGVVKVEVVLTDPPLVGLRPDQAVSGTIEIERVEDTLVIDRPPGVTPGSAAELFRLSDDGTEAERKMVRLGRGSVHEIEVVDGLAEGDAVVVSDSERLAGARKIAIQ